MIKGMIVLNVGWSEQMDNTIYPEAEMICNKPKTSNDLMRPSLLMKYPAKIAPINTEIGAKMPRVIPI